jgi:uncharacterized SAM-binding protein YcdF (DUF218 family)
MSVLLLTLIAAALLALIFERRRLCGVLLATTLVVSFLLGSGLLTRLALNGLQIFSRPQVAWQSKNWIVVLGLGTVAWPDSNLISTQSMGASRVIEAARLYYECRRSSTSCRVLTSGGDPSKTGLTEAEAMAHELSAVGVPASDVSVEPKSTNTFQNAQFSTAILRREGFERVVLVTSGAHLRRSMLYFSHFMDDLIPSPSDRLVVRLMLIPSSMNVTLLEMAVHEYMGMLLYQGYQFFGLNPRLP